MKNIAFKYTLNTILAFVFSFLSTGLIAQTVDFSVNETVGCDFLNNVQFINESSNDITSFIWVFSDSLTSIESTEKEPVINFSPGEYDVTLKGYIAGSMVDSITKKSLITVYNSPIASFVSDMNNVKGPILITFTDESIDVTDITNYKWFINDELLLSDTTTSFEYSFTSADNYDVRLEVTDAYTCQDDTTITVTITPTFEVPNVFTPNGDGKNDLFEINQSGIVEFSIDIYNRWGALVFTETSPYINWTGKTIAGVDVPTGTYFYVLKAKDFQGNEYPDYEKGNITLIR